MYIHIWKLKFVRGQSLGIFLLLFLHLERKNLSRERLNTITPTLFHCIHDFTHVCISFMQLKCIGVQDEVRLLTDFLKDQFSSK